MARQTWIESEIPTGVESAVYLDARQIARALGKHNAECFIGKATGAGGVGGSITGIPFEPAVVQAINSAGAAPAVHDSVFASSGAVHVTTILAVAANATPPTKTKVADNNWTLAFPVGMLPNAEVMTAVIYGVRDVAGGL